jgi:hypothetical protein
MWTREAPGEYLHRIAGDIDPMEVLVTVVVIWVLWLLFRSRDEPTKRRSPPERPESWKHGKPDSKLKDWQDTRDRHENEAPLRRERVLSLARAERLTSKQIATVLETSTQFGFSAAEILELKSLQVARGNAVASRETCRVCGGPALPGEDLCYSHQAK